MELTDEMDTTLVQIRANLPAYLCIIFCKALEVVYDVFLVILRLTVGRLFLDSNATSDGLIASCV